MHISLLKKAGLYRSYVKCRCNFLYTALYKNRHTWCVCIVIILPFAISIYACITLVQGCDVWQMFECAGVLVECAAVCASGIDDPDCIECMGDLYDTCKDCFSTMEATEKQAGKFQEV